MLPPHTSGTRFRRMLPAHASAFSPLERRCRTSCATRVVSLEHGKAFVNLSSASLCGEWFVWFFWSMDVTEPPATFGKATGPFGKRERRCRKDRQLSTRGEVTCFRVVHRPRSVREYDGRKLAFSSCIESSGTAFGGKFGAGLSANSTVSAQHALCGAPPRVCADGHERVGQFGPFWISLESRRRALAGIRRTRAPHRGSPPAAGRGGASAP